MHLSGKMTEGPLRLTAASDLADPEYVAEIRLDMLRFAQMQLGSDSEAEDVVQEALAAAVRNAATFRSATSLKTWIIAILRHKIADNLRQRRGRPILASELGDTDGQAVPALFDRRGMWRDAARPSAWENPEALIHDRQFLIVFDACLNRLPPHHARLFLMREVIGMRNDEICAETGVSSGNLRVILHRARLALRACLQQNGIQP